MMSETNQCRLCLKPCKDYLSYYDNNGERNNVYSITVKYFHPMFLEVENPQDEGGGEANHQDQALSILCVECWNCIFGFYKFQETILLTQTKLFEAEKEISTKSVEPLAYRAGHIEKIEPESTDRLAPSAVSQEVSVATPSTLANEDKNANSSKDNSNTNPVMSPSTSPVVIKIEPSESIDSLVPMMVDPNIASDTENDIILAPSTSKYTEQNLKYSNETDSADEDFADCTLDEGHVHGNYSTIKKSNNTTVHAVTHHKMEYSSSEADELEDGHNEEFLSDDGDVSPNNEDSNSTEHEFRRKEEPEMLCGLDLFIAHYEPNLKCGICAETRPTFAKLKEHFVQSHRGDQCHILCCTRQLKSRRDIEEHIRVHLNRDIFQCKVCKMLQATVRGLKTHLFQRHGMPWKKISVFKPDIAEKSLGGRVMYKQLDDFIAQWRAHFKCRLCSQECPTFTHLQKHFKRKHRGAAECYIECCGLKLFQHHQVEEHVILHQNPSAFNCQQCHECFDKRRLLYSHCRLQHPILNDRQVRTAKVVNRKSMDAIDKLIATYRPELPCSVCAETKTTFTLLQKHFLDKHPNVGFSIVCCERKFDSRTRFLKHYRTSAHDATKKMRYIEPAKQFDGFIAKWKPNLECVVCQKLMPTYTLLRKHFREMHAKQECYINCCYRKLKRRSDIERHIREAHNVYE